MNKSQIFKAQAALARRQLAALQNRGTAEDCLRGNGNIQPLIDELVTRAEFLDAQSKRVAVRAARALRL